MITKVLRITLVVRNQDEALSFYTEKLGFKKRSDQSMGPMRWLTVSPKNDNQIEIVLQPLDWFQGAERERLSALVGQNPTLVLQVDDCRRTYEELNKCGVEFDRPPEQRPYGLEALARDLYGNSLVLLEPAT